VLKNLSTQGKVVIGVLMVLIVIFAVTKPPSKPPAPTIRVGPKSAATIPAVEGIPNPADVGADNPPVPQPAAAAPAPAPTPAPVAVASAGAGAPDFELLKDRFGRSDPFAPLHPPVKAAPALPPPMPMDLPKLPVGVSLPPLYVDRSLQFNLTGISMMGDGRGIALMNGQMLHVGEMIKNYTITQITKDTVKLRSDVGENVTLTIKQAAQQTSDLRIINGVISNVEAPKSGSVPQSGGNLPVPGLPSPTPGQSKTFDSGL
jgi:hypothetical protein